LIRTPEALAAFYNSRLLRLQKTNFLGMERDACDVTWSEAVVPSVALMLATLGHRDASTARSIVRERILPTGLKSINEIPKKAFPLVVQLPREVTISFPMAVSNVKTDDPRFISSPDFYFKSQADDPVQITVHKKPYYPGIKGLAHIIACEATIDLENDAVLKDGVKLLSTGKNIRVRLPTTLPRLTNWQNADYSLFMMVGQRNFIDMFEFDTTGGDVLSTIAALYVSLMSRLVQKVVDVKALSLQFSQLADWITKNFNHEAFVQDAYPLLTSWKWEQFITACVDTSVLLEKSAKGIDMPTILAKWEGLFDQTFPAYVSSGMPLYYVPATLNVTLLLDDKMRGVARFPTSPQLVELVAPSVPLTVFKDTHIAYSMLKSYADVVLRSLYEVEAHSI